MKFYRIIAFALGLLLLCPYMLAQERIIYVSSSGDDNNYGITETSPLKTISYALKRGDIVLLKAGDVFYENLLLNNKKLGRYGIGKNPVVCGFKRIVKPNWQKVDDNIWKILLVDNNYDGFIVEGSSPYNGIGCIYEYNKDELHGHRVKAKGLLSENWDFWQINYYDNKTNPSVFDELYLYLDENPNLLQLAFSVSASAARVDKSTIENVDFTGFGFGLGCGSDVTIRNCKLDMLGGRIISGDKNVCCYGNGIEFYLGASKKNCLVEGCIISRCYDCGITIQGVPTSDKYGMQAYPKNIVIRNNLITNCCQGWEEFLNNSPQARFINCLFENNIVLNSGETGWGYELSRRKFCHVLNTNMYGNRGMVLRNNIFAGGNFINSLFVNDSYISDTWENNIVYIAYGYDLVRDPDAVKRIVKLTDRKSKRRKIEEYRCLTGDNNTKFYVWSDKRVRSKARSLLKKYLRSYSNN